MLMPTFLDAVALAPAAMLGSLGIWLGFGRSAVAWPMRWLIPFFGACAAAGLAALFIIVNGDMAHLFYLSGIIATTVVAAVAFLVALVLLLMFMRNLRERVAIWTGSRRIGLVERMLGGVLGIACGLLLVAILYGLHEAIRPETGNDPSWAQESVSLPYFKGASEAVKSAVSSYLPLVASKPRR